MSSAGQIVGGIVGAVIGFYVGGPVGAFQGAALGAGIGGVLDPPKGPTVEGPKLQDKGVQTSTYGAAIPRIYGIIGGAGNITQLENNKLKETVRKESSGGKGGGSSTTTKLYTYSATFQLSLCEGPIAGVRRIWCADKLIYNAGSDDLETIIASNEAASGFKIYLGTDDQMPDPRYEAEYGVGNVSAHRGEAYIAFYDFPLADYSNTLQAAQFKVEIVTISNTSLHQLSETTNPPSTNFTRAGGVDSDGFLHLSTIEDDIVYEYVARGSDITRRGAVIDFSSTVTFGLVQGLTPGGVSYRYKTLVNAIDSTVMVVGSASAYISGTFAVSQLAQFGDSVFYPTASSACYFSSTSSSFVVINGINSYPLLGPFFAPEGQAINAGMFDGKTCVLCINSISNDLIVYSFDMSVTSLSFTEELRIIAAPGVYRGFHDLGIWTITHTSVSETNLKIYGFDGQILVDIVGPLVVPGTGPTPRFFDNAILASEFDNSQNWRFFAVLDDYVTPSLSDIIDAEINRSGLISDLDIDTTLLTDYVRGYRVNGGALRAAIEPLQAAFPFDVRQHGYKIQFLPRGQLSVATIQWEELGATDGNKSLDILHQSREMDSQLPARTTIKYLDAAREYAIAEQYSERLNTEAINRVDRQLPIVITANEAARVAEVLNFLPWLERTDAAFTLPPTYRYLEPGDIVTIDTQDSVYELRITELNEMISGLLEVKARPNRSALYTSSATGSEGIPPTGTIGIGGPSIFLPLDIPVVDETIQNAVGFVGVMTGITTGWPGGLAIRSNDGGQTWFEIQAFQGKATIGIARSPLSSSNGTMIDQSSLIVDMVSGSLESITKDQMLSGINYAAYGSDGRWEIVRFQNATLQVDGSYLVSNFMRGERGTEWSTGLHVASDYFVLLDDPDNAFIGSPVESIAFERLYRGVTAGASIDSASNIAFTYQGVNLECLSPVYARGTRDGSSNFTGTFTRRSRLSSSWWTTGTEAPFGETTQSYEIDVMNGSTVARTIAVTTPSFSYSAVDQTTDFGSPQSSIVFRIYQLSGTVGRGYPYEVTL